MPSNKSECHDLETRDRTKVHGYEEWIRAIKERIQRARVKASMLVNSEQTLLYWDIGHDILEKQESEGWGTKVVERMSVDLKAAFPDMTGWSPRNLKYMRAFADAWARKEIVQAPLAQLPWYHHLALLECLKSRGDRIAYAALAIENGWSRNVMVHQIELGVADQHGTAIVVGAALLNALKIVKKDILWGQKMISMFYLIGHLLNLVKVMKMYLVVNQKKKSI